MKLPKTSEVVETLQAKVEASEMVDNLIRRNFDLEEIFHDIQPLLYELSVKLYGDNAEDISLQKLIEDSVAFLKGSKGEVIQ